MLAALARAARRMALLNYNPDRGGVAVDPDSGNSFFRITRLNLNLSVPEPATGMALVAGLGGLAFVARRRSRR